MVAVNRYGREGGRRYGESREEGREGGTPGVRRKVIVHL